MSKTARVYFGVLQSKGQPMEQRLQVRMIPRISTVHLMRQRRQRALWMKGLQLLEKANMNILLNLLLLRFVRHLHFPLYFFLCIIFSILQVSSRSNFQIEVETDLSLDLSFLDHTTPTPQSSVRLPSDLDVATTCSTMSHLLGLDMLSLSTIQNNAFSIVLKVLASASKVPQSKIFISEALAHTSSTSLCWTML